LQKAASQRVPERLQLDFSLDDSWDTIRSEIFAKIISCQSTAARNLEAYAMHYYIWQHVSKPGLLFVSESDYTTLLGTLRGLKTIPPLINLIINEASSVDADTDKENQGTGGKTEKKKKAKRLDPDTLPGNVAKATWIQQLQEKWICDKCTPSCVGKWGFVDSQTQVHLALNPERLDLWAAAILKEDSTATLNNPPNHHLFDPERLSPVLQRRKEALAASSSQASTSAPLTLISDLINAIHPQALPVTPTLPVMDDPTRLLSTSRFPGLDMPLAEFCRKYELSDDICTKLTTNAFKNSRSLRFLTLEDVHEMKFLRGEIAALHDALEMWSTAVPSA
ncbi:hypothetical protein H0H81_003942, partial [Sphagnurus paluster]